MEALAVYGTLAPGEKNHWVLRSITGEWGSGSVRGYLFDITWGPAEGYRGFLPDDEGADIAVTVLRSEHLEKNWRSIDDFEGEGYVRRLVPVTMDGGEAIDAWMYVTLTNNED